VVIEYTGQQGDASVERKLSDSVWTRLPLP